jgi:Na+/melibiose symporter-like transporter
MSRSFLLGLVAVWVAAAAMLYYLAPGLGATYLVASGWVAFVGAAIWALARWPPFKRTLTRRRGGPKDPGGATPGG